MELSKGGSLALVKKGMTRAAGEKQADTGGEPVHGKLGGRWLSCLWEHPVCILVYRLAPLGQR